MHICLFSIRNIHSESSVWGGVHTHVKHLVELLLENDFDVSLITGDGVLFEGKKLRIIPIGGNNKENSLWFKKAQSAFINLNKKQSVDCIFLEGWAGRDMMTNFDCMNIPVVAFVHLMHFHYFYNIWQEVEGIRSLKSYFIRSFPSFIYGMVLKDFIFIRKCQKVVTGSLLIANQIKKIYGVHEEKVETIHNWVDTKIFSFNHVSRSILRNELGICQDSPVFLIVGALRRAKGFRVVLRAFDRITVKIPNAFLLIAGDGPDRYYLQKQIQHVEEKNKHVKFIGAYPHKELPSLYSCADVFILPSLMNEVLPYTLIEAMSCSLPVIATDISASREALGASACLVPRGDVANLAKAMLEHALNLNSKKADAKSNRQRVQNYFSTEAASQKITSLISSVVSKK